MALQLAAFAMAKVRPLDCTIEAIQCSLFHTSSSSLRNVKHKFCSRAKFAYLDVVDGKLAGEIRGLAQITGTISDTRFKVVPLANSYVTISFDASDLVALADISELIYFELS